MYKWMNKWNLYIYSSYNDIGKPFPWYSIIPLKLFVTWVHVIYTCNW